MHPQAPPGPLRNPVSVAQTCREGAGVERSGCPDKLESFGQLSPVAERTVELRADLSRPLGLVHYPWPLLERWLVPDVLVVQARQLGHPVTSLVLVEPDDGSLHPLSLADRGLADGKVIFQAGLAMAGDVAVQGVRAGLELHRGGVDAAGLGHVQFEARDRRGGDGIGGCGSGGGRRGGGRGWFVQEALETRRLVERAKGLLMDRLGPSEEHAFLRIQHRARDANRKMADVARQLIDASDILP